MTRSKSYTFVFALLALSVFVVGCSGDEAAPTPDVTIESNGQADMPLETVVDDLILDESDDVEIGELIA